MGALHLEQVRGRVKGGVMGDISRNRRVGAGVVAAGPGMLSKHLVSDFFKGRWVAYWPGTFAPPNVFVHLL